jgi:hypothetical protein
MIIAVLLAPYGSKAKHGAYCDRKLTFFKWDTMIYLPEEIMVQSQGRG